MPSEPDETEVMIKFGITKSHTVYYHYLGWRYSNLDDAIAQAKRDAASTSNL